MNAVLKKGISVITVIAAAIAMCFCIAGTDAVYADQDTETAISVYENTDLTVPVKEFTLEELKQIANDEGDRTYNYSGYNTYPSFKTYLDTKGPTVLGVLRAAGIEPGPDTLVKISDRSGYSLTMISSELTEDRYYYPNGKTGTENGGAATEAAYKDAVKVPAIIDISSEGMKDSGIFRFGQVAPNEQNFPGHVKYVANDGKIIVGGSAEQCSSAVKITDGSGKALSNNSNVTAGTELHIEAQEKNVKIYYSLDGSEPADGSQIYNYSEKVQIKYPTLDTYGKVTLKVLVTKYGKYDSEISTFVFNVCPAAPSNFKAAGAGYNKVKLTWTPVSDASGYTIAMCDSKTKKYVDKKSVTGASAKSAEITGLKTGTKYSFKIKSYKKVDGEKIDGSFSSVKYATPTLSAPSITKLTAGSKSIKVTWTKVSGATGYDVYRATSKSGKYRLIKTVKTTSYTNKSLKKGKKYYYKVRTYRMVNGEKVCSSYSAVKYSKAK